MTAALRQERVDLDFKSILLPRIPKSEKRIPTEDEIAVILHMIEGTSVELPVTIAVTLVLRQSEIATLRWDDYNGSTLKIHSARVPNKENKYIIKDSTKSKASTREIEVDELLKRRQVLNVIYFYSRNTKLAELTSASFLFLFCI